MLTLLLCMGVAAAARLDNTYLPPSSAGSAGGNGNFLGAPNGGSNGGSLGNTYLPPAVRRNGNSNGRGNGNGVPQQQYGAPLEATNGLPSPGPVGPSPVYGVPNGHHNGNGRSYASPEARASILRFNNENNGDGNYRFEYETENKISQQELGQVKDVAPEGGVTVVQGTYSYVGDDGQTYTVNYVADENGFQPTGDHIHSDIQQTAAEAARSAASEVGYPGGYNGRNGYNGQNGYSGQNGYNGQNGQNGQNGSNGQDGQDGYRYYFHFSYVSVAAAASLDNIYLPPSSAPRRPLGNTYLPPSIISRRPLGNIYLPPSNGRVSGGSGVFVQQHTQAIVAPSPIYGVPSGSAGPSPLYGVPSSKGYGSAEARANILRYNNENNGDGNYRFEYETENRISQQEVGQVKNLGHDGDATVVQGTYSYVGDDGQTYTVNYVADENGFQPIGDHIHKDIQTVAAEAARTAVPDVGYPGSAYSGQSGYRY